MIVAMPVERAAVINARRPLVKKTSPADDDPTAAETGRIYLELASPSVVRNDPSLYG